jgi:thiol:disulfide interchange protein DsbD
MIKKYIATGLLSLVWWAAQAQFSDPVDWHHRVRPTSDENVYEVVFTAVIAPPWHLYDTGPYAGGPNPTVFTFEPAEGVRPEGAIVQLTQPVRIEDAIFGMEIGYFTGQAEFAQRVRVIPERAAVLRARVEYMVCDEQICLPPEEVEFDIVLPPAGGSTDSADPAPAEPGPRPLWGLLLEAILWGLAAFLTPCVFPMAPVTVSFFLKGSGDRARGRRRASVYGAAIVLLYTLPVGVLILITYLIGGENITAGMFNRLATHWLPNLLFFGVFMLFAASFFGAFEIRMPSKWINRADAKSDRAGLFGVFFMALTLVLVSFSCTGPIVGSVLVRSTQGRIWEPVVTMLAFSAAFALPFTILAFFPALLKNLPRSGGWLNSVKVVLGFVEIALGLKFLSIADQTYHWGILDREVYLAIWIVVFTLLGFYLSGKIRFRHDGEVKHIGVFRLALVIAVFSFVVCLIPGMWGAPLKALAGYLPPMHAQGFAAGSNSANATPAGASAEVKYGDRLRLPHGLTGFFDYEQGMAFARSVGKPVFVDITGHGCVNCREMEARVWSDPQVLRLLSERYVIIALYVDDRTRLPQNQWVTDARGRTLKSLGRINAELALRRFGTNAQPYYALLDNDGRQLTAPRAYSLDIQAFVDFLQAGLNTYNQ